MATEREIIDEMQKSLEVMKRHAALFARNAKELGQINRDADRLAAANDAMVLEGYSRQIHGELVTMHGRASQALLEHFPELGGPVILGGGGGR